MIGAIMLGCALNAIGAGHTGSRPIFASYGNFGYIVTVLRISFDRYLDCIFVGRDVIGRHHDDSGK